MAIEKQIQEVLAILDLSEEEQEEWLSSKVYYPPKDKHDLRNWHIWWRQQLADLAFRMRDEAVKSDSHTWDWAKIKVCIKCADDILYDCWWDLYSQPIHWILAVIIANILTDNKMESSDND